jgi:adenylyltransferase/sulfurtransferase
MLKDDARRRYARHLVLPEIGASGQETLLASRVLVVGCGGLGSVAAGYLAAMGLGTLGLMDADRVELSNLQRQILFEIADIGQTKVAAAKARLEEINPDVKIISYVERFGVENANVIISNYDVVVDATDNFASRVALHDACMHAKRPLIYAAISGFEAMLTTFKSYLGAPHPCLHCFMPELPERENTCAQEGIVGALAGMVGSMQALEVVKELLGIGASLSGKILRYDALSGQIKSASMIRDAVCKYCA